MNMMDELSYTFILLIIRNLIEFSNLHGIPEKVIKTLLENNNHFLGFIFFLFAWANGIVLETIIDYIVVL